MPFEVLTTGIPAAKQSMMEDYGDPTQFKGVLFGMLFGYIALEEGPGFLFEEFKNNNIVIYPETPAFILIRHIPQVVLDKAREFAEGKLQG